LNIVAVLLGGVLDKNVFFGETLGNFLINVPAENSAVYKRRGLGGHLS
jgi:hypothetical protein